MVQMMVVSMAQNYKFKSMIVFFDGGSNTNGIERDAQKQDKE